MAFQHPLLCSDAVGSQLRPDGVPLFPSAPERGHLADWVPLASRQGRSDLRTSRPQDLSCPKTSRPQVPKTPRPLAPPLGNRRHRCRLFQQQLGIDAGTVPANSEVEVWPGGAAGLADATDLLTPGDLFALLDE